MRLGVGIDTGGTYTDAVIYDFETKKILGSAKSLTTKNDLSIGILGAIDGLPADLVKLIVKVKGPEHIIVTSDACSACGFPPGRYQVLGNDAVLEPSGRLYNPEKQCLVAAAATMEMCMTFLRSLDILSEEELLAVGRTNALKLLGME